MLHECGDSVLQEEKVLDAGSTTLDILNTTEQHDQKRVKSLKINEKQSGEWRLEDQLLVTQDSWGTESPSDAESTQG